MGPTSFKFPAREVRMMSVFSDSTLVSRTRTEFKTDSSFADSEMVPKFVLIGAFNQRFPPVESTETSLAEASVALNEMSPIAASDTGKEEAATASILILSVSLTVRR